MKKLTAALSVLCTIALAGCLSTGCVTSRQAQFDPITGQTNMVTVVNQTTLNLEAGALQGVTAVAVNFIINYAQAHNQPGDIVALQTANTSLQGILTGGNQQTTGQVIALLKAQGSPTMVNTITVFMSDVGSLEQQLLNKYGTTVAGQISMALTKAIATGLATGLAPLNATLNTPAAKPSAELEERPTLTPAIYFRRLD